jgi:hypothetical protein
MSFLLLFLGCSSILTSPSALLILLLLLLLALVGVDVDPVS